MGKKEGKRVRQRGPPRHEPGHVKGRPWGLGLVCVSVLHTREAGGERGQTSHILIVVVDIRTQDDNSTSLLASAPRQLQAFELG